MPWILLVIAGGLEVIWAIGLKDSHGFASLAPSLFTVIALLGSFTLVAWSLRSLSQHPRQALWAGIGIMAIILIAAFWLREGMNPGQLGVMMAITGGIVGLQHAARTNDDSASNR